MLRPDFNQKKNALKCAVQQTKDYEIVIFFRYLILIVATTYAGINTLDEH